MHVGVYAAGMPPESGGGYTFQDDILQALLARAGDSRHDYTILCDTPDLRRHFEARALPARVRSADLGPATGLDTAARAASLAAPFSRRLWRRAGRLQRALERHGIDVVWFVPGGAHEIPDAPYIATVWDVQHRTHPWLPEVSAAGAWESREAAIGAFLARAAFVITGTDTGRRELETYYRVPPSRVHLLPHPTPAFALEAGPSAPDIAGRFGLEPHYLLYPAQFWPHKNHVSLVLALERLKSRYGLALQLLLVGSDKGNRRHVEQAAARAGVLPQIKFPGFVSQAELVALYRNAGALVYPTLSGPENLPPLEAFALGCPVVASDIPGAAEQLGDCARLVSPVSPDAIAGAVYEVLTDGEVRAALIARGRERARAWTGADFVNGVLKILDEFEPLRRCWPPAGDRAS